MIRPPPTSFFFFFNDTATTEIYTLSLHDALPISIRSFSESERGRSSDIGVGIVRTRTGSPDLMPSLLIRNGQQRDLRRTSDRTRSCPPNHDVRSTYR